MYRKIFKVLTVVCVSMIMLGGAQARAQEYSADMESRVGQETMNAKIFVSKDKVRMEMPASVMIIRNDLKVSWMVMPSEKMYMEQPIDMSRAPKVQKTFDGEIERVSLGNETVNDQPAEKFKVTYTENGKEVSVYQWLVNGMIPVKVEAVDGSYSMDYKNLQIGAQAPDLFEPPPDFEKMQMPSLDFKGLIGL